MELLHSITILSTPITKPLLFFAEQIIKLDGDADEEIIKQIFQADEPNLKTEEQ